MRKISLLLMALMLALVASAEPANPTPVTVKQPNGENLRLVLVGDEYYHFNTTVDGYTIIDRRARPRPCHTWHARANNACLDAQAPC